MRVIRYGFKLLWREVPAMMRRYKVGKLNSFDPYNAHKGEIWGWPKECRLTSHQARTLLMKVYAKRTMTYPQMRSISKSLAYAYELSGGTVPLGNYAGVKQVWPLVRENECVPSTMSQKPEKIPEPEELKTAFSSPWTANHAWSLMLFLCGLISAGDLFVFGLRSREDIKRVKESRTHEFNGKQGWTCSKFVGGRSKLSGNKKDSVPWWIWRVCRCRKKKHVPVPKDFFKNIDDEGNPTVEVTWCTLCPLAALELIWQFQDHQGQERRCYGKWIGKKFQNGNTGDVAKFAIEWLKVQGATEDTFDTNAGRKSLARWTHHLNVPYQDSCPIHGDLHQTWNDSYDEYLPNSNYSLRTQPRDPERACAALRKFARFVGAGRKVKVSLSRRERFSFNILKALGHHEKAERIRQGLPSSDEESESDSD